jgi:hypothetical protein
MEGRHSGEYEKSHIQGYDDMLWMTQMMRMIYISQISQLPATTARVSSKKVFLH